MQFQCPSATELASKHSFNLDLLGLSSTGVDVAKALVDEVLSLIRQKIGWVPEDALESIAKANPVETVRALQSEAGLTLLHSNQHNGLILRQHDRRFATTEAGETREFAELRNKMRLIWRANNPGGNLRFSVQLRQKL